jgi:hypothetical protein
MPTKVHHLRRLSCPAAGGAKPPRLRCGRVVRVVRPNAQPECTVAHGSGQYARDMPRRRGRENDKPDRVHATLSSTHDGRCDTESIHYVRVVAVNPQSRVPHSHTPPTTDETRAAANMLSVATRRYPV